MVIDRKGLIFFGLILAFIMGFFILLGGVSFSRQQVCYIYGPAVRPTIVKSDTGQYDLPLPKPSTITTEKDDIRLDLERVTVHKYYIIYSVIYGDQSHTAYHLFLTDLNRKKLDPKGVGEIWLETASGERIEQVAEPTIYDYPKDQPLKWKIGIIAKFPYQSRRDAHKLFLRYQGITFKLTGISY
ncbi:hypothetical protein BBF96_14120 [Anoxybacter fermentans]|uniref:Uncharacterized protein n=1 Tax=Anoxybacter fermentans TaxID=1323375 RepID=A0A3Q9HSK7_9FIRM|nr:hypothetical protein [Anoxybacter fermentans]AZR74423.1 hypothetical protein BBF96_14120 [Anoxybacter fermentans]